MGKHNQPLHIRFDPSGCWIWTGLCNPEGYGQLSRFGRGLKAHRAIWQAFNGRTEKQLHHLCKVRNCVNPAHMIALTPSEHSRIHHPGGSRACRRGHSLVNPENLYVAPSGARVCRHCRWLRSNYRHVEAESPYLDFI